MEGRIVCCSGCSALHSLRQTATTDYNVLQCTAMYCNVLRCTATCSTITQGNTTLANTYKTERQHTTHCNATPATHSTKMKHAETHCNSVHQRQRNKKRDPVCAANEGDCANWRVILHHAYLYLSCTRQILCQRSHCSRHLSTATKVSTNLLIQITGKGPVEVTDA